MEIIKEEFPTALSIPLYAVISRDNRHFVFLEEENTAKLQEVRLGILDGWQIQVTDGGDDCVFTHGQLLSSNGSQDGWQNGRRL